MACETVRRRLSDGDGRVLRGTRLRAHLRSCSTCRRFQQELVQRPRVLAMLAPPLPVTAGAALIAQLLPASGAATMAAFAPKAVATIAVVVAAAGGTAAVRHSAPAHPRPPAAAVASATAQPRTPPAADAATLVAQAQDFPAKPAKREAERPRSKGRKRAHGSGRRAAGAKKKARGQRTATPRRPPERAAKARGPKTSVPRSSAVLRAGVRSAGTRRSRGPRPPRGRAG
jgi:hypothetical protein